MPTVIGLDQAVSSGLDSFICAVGWRLCASLKQLSKLIHDPAAWCWLSQNIVNASSGYQAWVIGGYGVAISVVCQQLAL